MFVHQGDVPFYPFSGSVEGKKMKHNGSVVLALGEKTGHKHVLTVMHPDALDVVEIPGGQFLVELREEAIVTHEEHLPIKLAPGKYHIGKEREYDHFAHSARIVVD